MPIAKRGPNSKPTIERFWEKVAVQPSGCWQWLGALSGIGAHDAGGYAQLRKKGKTLYAHRYAYLALHGPIDDGMHLDHLCRNRSCVNPLHLEPVTCRENLLRGTGTGARNATKTHCPKGHPLADENLIIATKSNGRTSRKCRACHNDRQRLTNLAYRLKKEKHSHAAQLRSNFQYH